MKDIIIEYDKFEEQKLWEAFTAFFRYVKGYSDWTDEEIALSMNIDDFKEFMNWGAWVLGFELKGNK